uniref:Uncharacterized protein n=1 Tax=Timema cristinae TaxID=61476 RepID=A0A7R9CN21_TIMCR|nr:unnamed protein product [Timema cristinae]
MARCMDVVEAKGICNDKKVWRKLVRLDSDIIKQPNVTLRVLILQYIPPKLRNSQGSTQDFEPDLAEPPKKANRKEGTPELRDYEQKEVKVQQKQSDF